MDREQLGDVEVVHGPMTPGAPSVLYQVTLAQGVVFTRPEFWGDVEDHGSLPDVVSHSGEVLRPRLEPR